MQLNQIIRNHINNLNVNIIEEPINPNFEFIFKIKFPNESRAGRPISIIKNRNVNFIEISDGTKLGEEHLTIFNNLNNDKRTKFVRTIHRIIVNKELLATINIKPDLALFIITDRIQLEEDIIPLEKFYDVIKSVYSCGLNCNIFIDERFSMNYDPNDYRFDDPNIYS